MELDDLLVKVASGADVIGTSEDDGSCHRRKRPNSAE